MTPATPRTSSTRPSRRCRVDHHPGHRRDRLGTNGDGTGNPAENFEWIDVLFGTFGQTGVNNGMCLKANSIYAVGNEGPYWQYASAKTCGQPVPGAATVTVTTYTGPPSANSEVPVRAKTLPRLNLSCRNSPSSSPTITKLISNRELSRRKSATLTSPFAS